MKPLSQKKQPDLLLFCLILVTILFSSSVTAFAEDVDVPVDVTITSTIVSTPTTDLSFGSIDLDPAGDTITIDCITDGGATTPGAGASVLDGLGASGLITIVSAGAFDIDITYPADAAVKLSATGGSGGLDIDLVAIEANSTNSSGGSVPKGAAVDLPIHIGGKIVLPAGQAADTYTGTMTVTLNYS